MQAPKMTDLIIEETSGVDHPAHLHEGWLVVKADNIEPVADVLNALPDPVEERMADDTTDATKAEDAATEAEAEETKDDLAIAEARIAELEARIAELEASADEPDVEEQVEESTEPADDDPLAKAAPEVREMIVKARQEAADAQAALSKEREDRADSEAIAKATAAYRHLTNIDPAKIGPALRRLALADADLAKAVEEALVAANAQQESADIFAELGKNRTTQTDAYSQMQGMAKAKVAAGESDTFEKAFASVVNDNPSLYQTYLNEKGA